MKANNEVSKAALKKRLVGNSAPGPGEYDPQQSSSLGNIAASQLPPEAIDELRRAKDKSLLKKLGISDSLLGKKGVAFSSTSPRFRTEEMSRNHIRNRTLNGDELQKPVYEL